MPLVPCPACTRQISDAAPTCPHCGHPMAQAPMAVARGTRSIAGAPGPEEELWRGNPSAKALLGAMLGTLLVVIALPVAAWVLTPLVIGLVGGISSEGPGVIARSRGSIETTIYVLVAALVLYRVARFVWRLVVLKSHHYRVTNQRIISETGVFSKRIEEIDMRLIDDFQLEQNFLERLLGIGDITILSSDRTAAQLVLLGLSRPRDLRELIRSSAYGATRGQLFTRET